MKAVF
ncbi:uncharacterized protein FFFS_01677 [Fusarium fujikuroi]